MIDCFACRRSRPLGLIGLPLLLWACSQTPAPSTAPPPGPAAETSAAAPAAAAPADTAKLFEGPQPPDGKWLVDEEGRQYFVHELPRVERSWMWEVEGKRIRIRGGMFFDVIDYNDTTFFVKIYREDPVGPPPVRGPATPVEPTADTYVVTTRSADRLQFSAVDEGLPRSAQWRHGFEVADMNGDGQLDIVHGPPRKAGTGRPAIFLGDGRGKWRPWTEARYPSLGLDYGDVAVADFDADGHPDLAVTSHLRGTVVLVGDGKGGFREWSKGIEFKVARGGAGGATFSSRAIAATDWNGDGRPDLVALGEGPTMAAASPGASPALVQGSLGIQVYLNRGDGTWETLDHRSGTQTFGDSLVAGDFDGDGRVDVATASLGYGNRNVLNLGQPDGSWKTSVLDGVRAIALVRSVAAGDFNRDGRVDLALAYTSNEKPHWRDGIDLLLAGEGGRWERRPLWVREGRDGIWSLAVGDLDGDRALDLVGLTGKGEAWVLLGDGTGAFTYEESAELASSESGCRGYGAALADLDADGADELVAGFAGEGTELLGEQLCKSGGALRAWKARRVHSPS